MATTYIDITGKSYGYLTVLGRSKDKNGRTMSECVCVCGTIKSYRSDSLKTKHTKSCGCKNPRVPIDTETLTINDAYRLHLGSANRRGIVSYLSRSEYESIIRKPCRYCGDFSFRKNTVKKMSFKMNSVDRVNNEPFYKIENSVPCCFICQHAKMAMTEDDFLNHIKKILKFRSQKWL